MLKRAVLFTIITGAMLLGLLSQAAVSAAPPAQAPTPTLPPVRIEVFEDVTVRDGPGTQYDRIGILIPGQTSAIIGRIATNRWVRITYIGGPDNTGWVQANQVRLVGDLSAVPTVDPPPTPTLPATDTPEFFATLSPPTEGPDAGRPPTFTAPAPGVRPTLLPAQGIGETVAFPPAILIIVLFVLGTAGGLLSLVRQRQ